MESLRKIYKPIQKELDSVDKTLRDAFERAGNNSIQNVTDYLLESPGKRLRAALVVLSARSTLLPASEEELIKAASCIELIHMASLLHDDVIDHSLMRHNRPTVNSKWGGEVAITLGNYLYAMAFELASSTDTNIVQCISGAAKAMSEGELIQVCERDNLGLLKERYLVIVEKKTASLFAASCKSGALISKSPEPLRKALNEYGLNFGIAFQIIDDYLDLAGEERKLGKELGQDIGVGEMTLPVLNLLESVPEGEREKLRVLLSSMNDYTALKKIKERLLNSEAPLKTKKEAAFFINIALDRLKLLPSSPYRDSLSGLAGYIMERGFNERYVP